MWWSVTFLFMVPPGCEPLLPRLPGENRGNVIGMMYRSCHVIFRLARFPSICTISSFLLTGAKVASPVAINSK